MESGILPCDNQAFWIRNPCRLLSESFLRMMGCFPETSSIFDHLLRYCGRYIMGLERLYLTNLTKTRS